MSIVFKGKYVNLRTIALEDAEITLKWRLGNRAKLMKSGSKTVDEQRSWIQKALEKSTEVTYIMEFRNQPVGMVGICNIDLNYRNCSLERLLIGEIDLVGKFPIAYETELLLCDYIFDVLKMHKLYGDVLEENKNMINFRKYLGYSFDGLLRDHYVINNNFKSTFCVSILEHEYKNKVRNKLIFLINLATL